MTPDEWKTSTDPREMLDALWGRATERKCRLFGAACCRRVWHLMADPRSLRLVEAAELLADGASPLNDWAALAAAGERAFRESERVADEVKRQMLEEQTGGLGPEAACHAAGAAYYIGCDPYAGHLPANAGLVSSAAANAARYEAGRELGARMRYSGEEDEHAEPMRAAWLAEKARQVPLVHCVFGDPFRPVGFVPRWRTADVVGLARGIYEDRAFDRLPLLADALMDAGCDDENLLAHCRSDGPHIRGCWPVDLVLGKE